MPVTNWQYDYVCLYPQLDIAGNPPASTPGTWRADYSFDDGTTTLSGSEYFTISTSNYLTLADGDSYDFSAGVMYQYSGGDFYYRAHSYGGLNQNQFLANNAGQGGLVDVGELLGIDLMDVPIPLSGYFQFGVPAVANHKFVS